MEFAFIIWSIGTLPSIASGMCFILFVVMACSLAMWAAASIGSIMDTNTEEDEIKLKKFSKLSGTVAAVTGVLWFFFLLVPDKETAYAMAAGYGVQSVAQNERVQKIAGQGVDVLEQYLAKTKKELESSQDKPKAEEDKK